MALSSSNLSGLVAGNVHPSFRTGLPTVQPSSMNRDFQIRFTAGFLALFTAAAITLAWINFQKEGQFVAPYDGVSWVERNGGVFADRVEPEGPGARAGIAAGDRLLTVNGAPISGVDNLVQRMYAVGAYFKIRYSLQRGSSSFDAAPILSAQEHTFNNWLRLIGLIYLGIGLYVLFRRWTAPGSTHFYVFCLVSFAFCSFHFTGKLNSFDRTIYWGNILAISPFILLYVLPYVFPGIGFAPMKLSVVTLGLLPLTFGYAIFRYKLMDVDLIFKRGMAYTLAAMAIAGAYFTAIALVGKLVQTRLPSAGTTGLVVAIVVTALLADPLRRWVQERMDRLFYRTRYDYRQTLVEFGRELSAETDLDKMLTAVVDRLSRTLLVDRMAIFLSSGERAGQFTLAKSFGIQQTSGLDLNFLGIDRPETTEGHIFFENTHHVPRENASARETISRLELNYYIPCRAQKATVAVLGLGKTVTGDFLSSEDVELLETVAGYLAIAIQNSRLYASLEQKVTQYERLKDFNENIVESINVGVLAVDLQDRIESWNSQMEVMYALPRRQALTRSLSEVFPPEFIAEFSRVRQSPGIHNLYKFRMPVPTGEIRTVNVAIAPLVTKKFSVAGRLIIMDDITERVELEHQLSQSDKLSSIGLLAAGVAHEVNTPLAVISSYAQMLSKQVQGDPQKSTLLEKITRQTFRASELVNNLLNYSRTSGAEFAEVDVNRVIFDTLSLLEHQFKTGRIRVQDELAAHLPPIQGNAGRLQQVFLNLFLNAKDAMPDGGTLKIATSNGDGVSVTVSDSGSGIAQEHIHRIYDPLLTTKSAVSVGQNRGTGLGLSATYGSIREHAGKIRVESSPEQGTTFYIDFPMIRKAVNV